VLFDVTKVVSLASGSPKTVFDINNSALSNTGVLSDYVLFKSMKIRAQKGVAKYVVSTKSQDADVTLRASILTKDRAGKVVVNTTSNLLSLKIRGSRFSVVSKIRTEDDYESASSLEAGNQF